MSATRSAPRFAALTAVALALVAVGGVTPAFAAPVVTIDPIPGEPLLKPGAGPVTLVLSGDADPGTEVTIATDDIPSDVVTPICGPVTAGADSRWTCTATNVADWVGQLRAYVFGSAVYSTPVSVIAAPTLTVPTVGADLTPTISGTIPLGGSSSVVTVTVDGVDACTANGLPGAAWSCDLPDGALTSDGPYAIGASQTKDFGAGQLRTSIESTATYELDTLGPATPAAFTAPASSPHVVSAPGLSLAGTAEAGGTVTVVTGATTLCGPVAVAGDGTWSCSATLATAGTFTLSIQQQDAAGNAALVPSSTVDVAYLPPVVVTPPTTYVAPPTSSSYEFYFEPDAIKTGLASTEARATTTDVVIQSLGSFCASLGGTQGGQFWSPSLQAWTTDCGGSFATVGMSAGSVTLPGEDQIDTCPLAYNSAFTVSNCGNISWTIDVRSEPTRIASGTLDPEKPTVVEIDLPAGIPAGDHHLVVTFTDEANPHADPLSIAMPITLGEPEEEPEGDPVPTEEATPTAAAADPGIGAWAWVLMALAVAAVIATSVFLVRRGRS